MCLGNPYKSLKAQPAPRFSVSRFWDECRRYDAVEFNSLGGMISILLKQPPRPDDADNPVRTVLSAGCPADRWEEFEGRFGVRIIEWFGHYLKDEPAPSWIKSGVSFLEREQELKQLKTRKGKN